jgi:uncharacterized tellurite resistance protein B-like protein
MGITNKLNAEAGDALTPGRVFIISLLYMMSIDGEIESEEVGRLLAILGGTRERGLMGVHAVDHQFIDRAIAYRSRHSVDTFLEESALILSDEQRRCILLNLVDFALTDGQLEAPEKQLFEKFLEAYNVSSEEFEPLFNVIMRKNNYGIFFSA